MKIKDLKVRDSDSDRPAEDLESIFGLRESKANNLIMHSLMAIIVFLFSVVCYFVRQQSEAITELKNHSISTDINIERIATFLEVKFSMARK